MALRIKASFGMLALAIACPLAPAAVPYTDLYTLGEPAAYLPEYSEPPKIGPGGLAIGNLVYVADESYLSHALVWKGSTPTDLHQGLSGSTHTHGTDGQRIVGTWHFNGPYENLAHAVVWDANGTVTDIHPAGPSGFSTAYAIAGGQIVGAIDTHAAVWNGPDYTFTDLHPEGSYNTSYSIATDGHQQVGTAYYDNGVDDYPRAHAMLWNGTNAAVDLHPSSGYAWSEASAVGGGQQGGRAGVILPDGTGRHHAMLWSGTNDVADLHPDGHYDSELLGTDGVHQVGLVDGRAAVWNGTAGSFIDLHASLPPEFRWSAAYAVEGNTVYGLALIDPLMYHAIAWTIVPEPTGAGLLAAGLLVGLRRRRAT